MATQQQTKWGQFRQLASWVLVLIVLAIIQPLVWNFVTSSAMRLQATRTAEDQSVALRSRLEEITGRLNESDQLVDQLSLSFLGADAAPQAVERLEQLAGRSGLALDIIAIQTREVAGLEEQEEVIPLSLQVKAVGTPSQLISYIDRVEHAPEVADIRSWTLAAAPEQDRFLSGQTYTLEMVVYFYLLKGI